MISMAILSGLAAFQLANSVEVVVADSERSVPSIQQRAITAGQIEFFLEIAFGDGGATLLGWTEPARVRLTDGTPGASELLNGTIAEINRIAKRSMLVRDDSAGKVDFRLVSITQFPNVGLPLRATWSESRIDWDASSEIKSGTILASNNLRGEALASAMRRNLGQILGLLYGSRKTTRSLFYENATTHSAMIFEPYDVAAIRILGENPELRGRSLSEVRQRLTDRYIHEQARK